MDPRLALMVFLWVWAQSLHCILCGEKLALLSATLRTYQKAACDTDQIMITCPRGTSISIEFAQYNKFIGKDGYTIEDLCPSSARAGAEIRGKAKHLWRGSIFGSPSDKLLPNPYMSSGYGAIPADVISSTSAISTNAGSSTETADAQAIDSNADNFPVNCMWPNALQYSLLQTVVEACQKKKHCKFHGSPQFYGQGTSGVGDASGTSSYHSSTTSSNVISNDPCPKQRKIVEVAYKCRPYEFRSKVACHNDVAQLECNPYSRIAVYSASFGRTEYESIQCPQPLGVREETCLASYATETVMQICHGRRRCNLAADANTFGTPCQPNSRMYLKVVYTCVPKQVLKESNDSEVEPDESDDFDGDINDLYDDELIYKESEAVPKLYSNTTSKTSRNGGATGIPATNSTRAENNPAVTNSSLGMDGVTTGMNPTMTHSADLSLEDDQERLYFYLLIIASSGVLFCILILATRLVLQRRRRSASDTLSNSSIKGAGLSGLADETIIQSGFNDTVSEIDGDIDLTSIPVSSVSKNENYVAPTSSLYTSLAPGQLSAGCNSSNSSTPGLINNPILLGARQSPDLIFTGPVTSILSPATVIEASVNSPAGGHPGSSAISTMVPITSLAQYTTAPTLRAGYIISPDGILQRPNNTPTPPAALAAASPVHPHLSTSQMQSSLVIAPINHLPGTTMLRRPKPNAAALMPQLSYDGSSPRTLSTGMPVSSQLYYG
ncbi:uncharacterized protein LOC115621899 [Scaptodrosophila lebanonensis]|uniref:Uncharacterized protein LOC115621899 n=1 Tax=Drosophila lebanonensis TaxID=7225 RepID=A0A6J2T8W8_DROLE|nr:uncharacterized protein LOC115621899 [Scaptodrosophila lebanonensis]